MKHTLLRSLGSRNFRLYFFGQAVSLIGTWVQQTALSWLVYRMTSSVFLLGLASFAAMIPNFFLSPLAGVLSDRLNRRRMILVTQTFLMAQAAALAWLGFSANVQVWHVIALNTFMGVVSSADIPVRQSFMVEMLENREDLPNAIALNATMVNLTRLIGPMIGGFVIAAYGERACFLINTVSFLAVILAVSAMRVDPREVRNKSRNIFAEMKAGFSYAYNFPPIASILLLLGIVSLMGMPYSVLLPSFVADILHGGPHTLGLLTVCSGAGALTASIYLAFRKSVLGMGKLMGSSAALFGVGLMAFSFSRSLALNFILLFATGFGVMVMMATANTLLQTITEDDKRGRIMSFYVMALLGVSPIGSLCAGVVATHIGAPATVFIGGAACVVGAMIFFRRLPLFRQWVRPIYMKMGILPAIGTVQNQ